MLNIIKQGIMKRVFNMRTILTVAAFFATVGIFAQSTDVPGTAAQYDETATTTYMMEGTTVPLYAEPDAYFHPSYDPDVAGSLTAGFTWTWSDDAGVGDLTYSQNDAQDNYVEVTAAVGSAGSYTVNVLENAPAAWGGCNDGTGEDLTLVVVAQPDATLSEDGTGGSPYNLCEGDGDLPTAVSADISDGWQNYRLVWTLEIKTLTSAGADNDYYDTDKTTVLATAPASAYAEEYTTAVPEEVAASGAHAVTSVAGGFTVIDNSSTVYTYTLTSINDQASRFGEFIALGGVDGGAGTFTYYAIGETVSIQVNPTPDTGPIYHIDGTWAQ